jgi:hypothetical protein
MNTQPQIIEGLRFSLNAPNIYQANQNLQANQFPLNIFRVNRFAINPGHQIIAANRFPFNAANIYQANQNVQANRFPFNAANIYQANQNVQANRFPINAANNFANNQFQINPPQNNPQTPPRVRDARENSSSSGVVVRLRAWALNTQSTEASSGICNYSP